MSHDGAIEPRDQLQAQVVERLRAAGGAPVSFDELRAMGIENPALLGYELAAAGLPIEQARDSARRALTLNLPAEHAGREDHAIEEPVAPSAEAFVPADGARRTLPLRLSTDVLRSRANVAASVALTVVVGAILALVLSAPPSRPAKLSADHPQRGLTRSVRASSRRPVPQSTSAGVDAVKPAQSPGPAQRTPSVAVSPVVAASLEAAGHQLLSEGRYAQAVGELRGALQASGGSVARCAEPTTEACLTFAYALYDLGSALRLEGDPHAAIPILSERLQIDNQRAAVEAQLDLARAGVA